MHDFDAMTEGELRAHFNALAHKVNEHLPAGTGFIVLAAPFGKDGVAQYVANVQPQDAANWMRETIARWNAKDFVPR